MKSLTKKLKQKQQAGETLVIPYIMAGAQGLAELAEEIRLFETAGACAIELGIPFSDPVADGPVIQEAGLRALHNQVTLKKIVEQLKQIECEVPLVIMTYLNPLLSYGLEELIKELQQTPVKGLIIPDMPFEHRDLFVPLLKETDIALVPLIALTTPRERMEELIEEGEGFIYAVAVNGVTGENNTYQAALDTHMAYIQQHSDKPVLVGFGISKREHVERFRKSCAGVIVGSKIVHLLMDGKKQEAHDFVKELAEV